MKYQLRKLNTHKSMDPDKIHPWILREVADVALQLSITFEKSWRTEEDWRKAIVTPIFKKGKKNTTDQSASPPSLESDRTNHSGGHHQARRRKESH